MDLSCIIKKLPEEQAILAAATACEINPANRPLHTDVPHPLFIALVTSKYWGAGGVNLTVGFMESIDDALASKILSYMNLWNTRGANVKFVRTKTSPQVRISRGSGGYWSYLGTDILHVPTNQQTMNLEGFTLNTPETEFARVIPHETFHTCGAPHEHMRKSLVALLDPAKTIAYFQRMQGWSASMVQQQVLTPLDEVTLMSTPPDQDSIMCYQIPGECTVSGQPIRGGAKIDESDFAFAAKVYPGAALPPPPPVVTHGRYVIEGDNLVVTRG